MIMLALGSYVLFIALSGDDYWNVTSFTYSLTLYNSIMFFVLIGICAHFKTMLLNTVQMISAFSFSSIYYINYLRFTICLYQYL